MQMFSKKDSIYFGLIEHASDGNKVESIHDENIHNSGLTFDDAIPTNKLHADKIKLLHTE